MSDEEAVPLSDLLRDAGGVLRDGDYVGLAAACQIAAVKLGGFPSREGESFVKDILEVLDKADEVDRMPNTDTVKALSEAVEQCRAWGLDPGKRLPNALRQVITSIDTIRTFAETAAAEAGGDDEAPDIGVLVGELNSARNSLASISKACSNLLDALGIAQPPLDG